MVLSTFWSLFAFLNSGGDSSDGCIVRISDNSICQQAPSRRHHQLPQTQLQRRYGNWFLYSARSAVLLLFAKIFHASWALMQATQFRHTGPWIWYLLVTFSHMLSSLFVGLHLRVWVFSSLFWFRFSETVTRPLAHWGVVCYSKKVLHQQRISWQVTVYFCVYR